jgi:hypothetical protein
VSGGTLESYLPDAIEGALVYDAVATDYETYAKHIISGPLLSCELGPDDIDRFSDGDTLARMAPGLSGAFRGIALHAMTTGCSSFDKVGIGIYERLLREIPGIRIGRVFTECSEPRVVWEKTEEQARVARAYAEHCRRGQYQISDNESPA